MAYEEYDYYNEPSTGSLKDSLYQILNGLQDRTKLREAGTSLKEALQLTPNVTESLGRGGVAQAIGTSGDLRDLSNTINSYLPKGVRNFTRAAEFLANPYATAIQQTAPNTEQTLDFVPRISAPYEGYKQHETLGEYVAPALGYLGGKLVKATKDLPIGLSIEDVSKATPNVEVKGVTQSEIDALGFHSPLENAILKIQQPKGTGDQFLKQLEKTPGVKTEELDVTGVKQYLLDHPTVTKQELLDYMGESRLKLENKILDESMSGADTYDEYSLRGGDVYHDEDYIRSLADDLHYDMKNDDVIRSQEREALLEADPERYADYETNPYAQARLEEDIDGVLYENAKQQAHDMYYENPITHHYDDYGYDIYGNPDNGYSIKDPNGRFLDLGGNRGIYDIDEAQDALRQHLLDEGVIDIGSEGGPKYEDYTLPGNYTNYREVLTTLPPQKLNYSNSIRELTDEDKARLGVNEGVLAKVKDTWGYYPSREIAEMQLSSRLPQYSSSHFDEPNILAHTRLNDRIINGKKTLMVEEIQSDWHQAGRRKGYQGNGLTAAEKAEYDALQKEADDLMQRKDLIIKNLPPEKMNRMRELSDKKAMETKGVPDAPFKKNWHELMMKQILNEAVKGDYDAIAFTTGKQQADRYNLQKHVNLVSAMPTKDGKYQVYLEGKDGDPLFRGRNGFSEYGQKDMTAEELEATVGKDVAKKLIEGTPNKEGWVDVRDSDLAIGGEGMKGFYDKILPDFVNKYTKKYGMSVRKANTQASLQGEQVHMVDLTDAAKKDIKEKGQPLFSGIGLAAPGLLMDDEDNY